MVLPRVQLRHLPSTGPQNFLVEVQGGPATEVRLPDPTSFPVDEAGRRHLLEELRWHLEDFPRHPFPPATERSREMEQALSRWRSKLRSRLPTAEELEVCSSDPGTLSWPWEALLDGSTGFRSILRQPTGIPDSGHGVGPPAAPLRVLFVSVRLGAEDLPYRAVSRPALQALGSAGGDLFLLRPATVDALRDHLHSRRGHYHVLHLDTHGELTRTPSGTWEGQVFFATREGPPWPVLASELCELLADLLPPLVVLNACRSGMLHPLSDLQGHLATTLLHAGARAVVAMSHNLYLSGATAFSRSFYGELAVHGRVGTALRRGRAVMRQREQRTFRGHLYSTCDWIVPVLYQRSDTDLPISSRPPGVSPTSSASGPGTARFVGRDRAILHLEGLLSKPPRLVLIHGFRGIGKTALLREFLGWVRSTGGDLSGICWIDLSGLEDPLTLVSRGLHGSRPARDQARRSRPIRQLTETMLDGDDLVVLDGFERVGPEPGGTGSPPSSWHGLARRLRRLGDRCRVFVLSRHREEWLGDVERVELEGLDERERWELARHLAGDSSALGFPPDRSLQRMIDFHCGHPGLQIQLLAREVLELRAQRPDLDNGLSEILDRVGSAAWTQLRRNVASLQSLPHPLLPILSLHVRGVDAELFESIHAGHEPAEAVASLFAILERAGMARGIDGRFWELNRLLTTALALHGPGARKDVASRFWRGLAHHMSDIAQELDRLPPGHRHRLLDLFRLDLDQARQWLAAHDSTADRQDRLARLQLLSTLGMAHREEKRFDDAEEQLETALRLAEQLEQGSACAVLQHHLGLLAEATGRNEEAVRRFRQAIATAEQWGDRESLLAPHHHLGRIRQDEHRFEEAREHFLRAGRLAGRLDDPLSRTKVLLHLGTVAKEQKRPGKALGWFRRTLSRCHRLAPEDANGVLPFLHHQLGTAHHALGGHEEARRHYRRALTLKHKLGLDRSSTLHQVALLAQETGDPDKALLWHSHALGDPDGTTGDGNAAFQIGWQAAQMGDLEMAERWFEESLRTEKRPFQRAWTLHELGTLSIDLGNYHRASELLNRAIEDPRWQGSEEHVSRSYYELGRLGALYGEIVGAGRCMIRALWGWHRSGDQRNLELVQRNLVDLLPEATDAERQSLKQFWNQCDLDTRDWELLERKTDGSSRGEEEAGP